MSIRRNRKKKFLVKIHQWHHGALYDSEDEFDTIPESLRFIDNYRFCSAKIFNLKGQVVYNYIRWADLKDDFVSYA